MLLRRRLSYRKNLSVQRLAIGTNLFVLLRVPANVASIKTIGREERQKKLTSRPLFEITCLIYMHRKVTSRTVCQKGMEELREFANGRMKRHVDDYFADNQLVSTSFAYLQKLVDNP